MQVESSSGTGLFRISLDARTSSATTSSGGIRAPLAPVGRGDLEAFHTRLRELQRALERLESNHVARDPQSNTDVGFLDPTRAGEDLERVSRALQDLLGRHRKDIGAEVKSALGDRIAQALLDTADEEDLTLVLGDRTRTGLGFDFDVRQESRPALVFESATLRRTLDDPADLEQLSNLLFGPENSTTRPGLIENLQAALADVDESVQAALELDAEPGALLAFAV